MSFSSTLRMQIEGDTDVQDKLHELAEALEEAADAATQAERPITTIGEAMSNMGRDAVNASVDLRSLSKPLEELEAPTAAAAEAMEAMGATTADAAELSAGALQDFGGSAEDAVDGVADAGGEIAEAFSDIGESAEEGIGSAVDTIDEFGGSAEEGFSTAAESTEVFSGAMEEMGDATADATDAASGAMEDFGDAAGTALEDTVTATDDYVTAIETVGTDTASALDESTTSFEDFGDAAATSLDDTTGSLDDFSDTAVTSFTDAIDATDDYITSVESVGTDTASSLDDASTAFGDLGIDATAGFGDAVDSAAEYETEIESVGDTTTLSLDEAGGSFDTLGIEAEAGTGDAITAIDDYTIAVEDIATETEMSVDRATGALSTLGTSVNTNVSPAVGSMDEFGGSASRAGGAAGVAAGGAESFGGAVQGTATAMTGAATGLISLFYGYGQVQKAQNRAAKAATAEDQARVRVATITRTLNDMREKGTSTAQELADKEEELVVAEENLANAIERTAISASDAEEIWVTYIVTTGPAIIAVAGGISEALQVTNANWGALAGGLKKGIGTISGAFRALPGLFRSFIAGLTGTTAAASAANVALTATTAVSSGATLSLTTTTGTTARLATVLSTTTASTLRLNPALGGLAGTAGAATVGLNAAAVAGGRATATFSTTSAAALRLNPQLGGMGVTSGAAAVGLNAAAGGAARFGLALRTMLTAHPILLIITAAITGLIALGTALKTNAFGITDAFSSLGKAIGDVHPFLQHFMFAIRDSIDAIGSFFDTIMGGVPEAAAELEGVKVAADGTAVSIEELDSKNIALGTSAKNTLIQNGLLAEGFEITDQAAVRAKDSFLDLKAAEDQKIQADYNLIDSTYGVGTSAYVAEGQIGNLAQHIRDNAIANSETKTSMDALGQSYFETGQQLDPLLKQLGIEVDLSKVNAQEGWNVARSKAALVKGLEGEIDARFRNDDALRAEVISYLFSIDKKEEAIEASTLEGQELEDLAEKHGINKEEVEAEAEATEELNAEKEESIRVSTAVKDAFENEFTAMEDNLKINQQIIKAIDLGTISYDENAIAIDAVAKGKMDAALAGYEEYHSIVETATALGFEGDTRRDNVAEMIEYTKKQEEITEANEDAVDSYFDLTDVEQKRLHSLDLSDDLMGKVATGQEDLTNEQRLAIGVMAELAGETEPNIEGMAQLVRSGEDLERVVGLTNKQIEDEIKVLEKSGESFEATEEAAEKHREELDKLHPVVFNIAGAWGLYENAAFAATEEGQRMMDHLGELDSQMQDVDAQARELALANGLELKDSFSMTTEEIVDFITNLDNVEEAEQSAAEAAEEESKRFAEAWKTSFDDIKTKMDEWSGIMSSAADTVFDELGADFETGAEDVTIRFKAGLGFNEQFWNELFPQEIIRNAMEGGFDVDESIENIKAKIQFAVDEGLITPEQALEWFGPLIDYMSDKLPEDAETAMAGLNAAMPFIFDKMQPAIIGGVTEIGEAGVQAAEEHLVQPLVAVLESAGEGENAAALANAFVENIDGAIHAINQKDPELAATLRSMLDVMDDMDATAEEKVQAIVATLGDLNPEFAAIIEGVNQDSDEFPDLMDTNIKTPAQETRDAVVGAFIDMKQMSGEWSQAQADAMREAAGVTTESSQSIEEALNAIPESTDTLQSEATGHFRLFGGGLEQVSTDASDMQTETTGEFETLKENLQSEANLIGTAVLAVGEVFMNLKEFINSKDALAGIDFTIINDKLKEAAPKIASGFRDLTNGILLWRNNLTGTVLAQTDIATPIVGSVQRAASPIANAFAAITRGLILWRDDLSRKLGEINWNPFINKTKELNTALDATKRQGSAAMTSLAGNIRNNMNTAVRSMNNATSAAVNLRNAINNIRSRAVTLTTRFRTVGTPPAGGGGFRRAQHGFSGVVTQPTQFLTGEGNRPEFVQVTPLSPNASGDVRMSNNNRNKAAATSITTTIGERSIIRAGRPKVNSGSSSSRLVDRAVFMPNGEVWAFFADGRVSKTGGFLSEGQVGNRTTWHAIMRHTAGQMRGLKGTDVTKRTGGGRPIPEERFDVTGLARTADPLMRSGGVRGRGGKSLFDLRAMMGGSLSPVARRHGRGSVRWVVNEKRWKDGSFWRKYNDGSVEFGQDIFRLGTEYITNKSDLNPHKSVKDVKYYKSGKADVTYWNDVDREGNDKVYSFRHHHPGATNSKKRAQHGFSGIVTKPTEFITGEGGRAERVTVQPLVGGGGAGGTGGAGGGGRPIMLESHITVKVSEREIANAVRKELLGGIYSMS